MNKRHRTRNTLTCTRIISLTALGASASGAFSEVITVDDDGKADFASIQAAVDYASDGDEILVAPGVYTGDHPAHVVDLLGKAITLRSSDGPEVTFIDGQGVRRGIACFNDETGETTIEGFTIRHGAATPHDYDESGTVDTTEDNGGGLYAFESSPTLIRCTFKNNSASSASAAMIYSGSPGFTDCLFTANVSEVSAGTIYLFESAATLNNCSFIANVASVGGAVCTRESDAVFHSCTFSENFALRGGAMSNHASSLQLIDCSFTNNVATAHNGGGGIYNSYDTSSLTNCVFSNNQALNGGGMSNNFESSPLLEGCQFIENSATGVDEVDPLGYEGEGGAIFNARFSNASLNACSFTRNSATRPGLYNFASGGAISVRDNCDVSLTNCIFSKNNTDGYGGSVYTGGGNDSSVLTITDCTFTTNTAAMGGGLYVQWGGTAFVTGGLFVDNSAFWEGGAIKNAGGLRLANAVVCGNEVGQIAGLYADDGGNCLSNLCRDTDGDGRFDCSEYGQDDSLSVPDEYPTIEDAIDAAAEGALIKIAAGTYAPTLPISTLGKAVHLRGTVDDEGRPATILDGEDARQLLRCMNGEDADTRLENLVLTRGKGFAGGAMTISESSPTLVNCIFTNNFTEIRGGGILIKFAGSPTLTNCTFTSNTAYSGLGGGLCNWLSEPLIQDCTFIGNYAWVSGGGVWNDDDLLLSESTVCGNAPDQIIGPWIDQGGNTVRDNCISDCFFDFNGDGVVDGEELTFILGSWGTDDPVADVNDDGIVDGNDLTIILASWGACP